MLSRLPLKHLPDASATAICGPVKEEENAKGLGFDVRMTLTTAQRRQGCSPLSAGLARSGSAPRHQYMYFSSPWQLGSNFEALIFIILHIRYIPQSKIQKLRAMECRWIGPPGVSREDMNRLRSSTAQDALRRAGICLRTRASQPHELAPSGNCRNVERQANLVVGSHPGRKIQSLLHPCSASGFWLLQPHHFTGDWAVLPIPSASARGPKLSTRYPS